MAAPGARPHPNTCPGHSRSYGASHVSHRHPAAGMLPRGEIRRGLTACRRGAVPATLQFCAAQKTNILSNRGCYCDVLVLRKKKKIRLPWEMWSYSQGVSSTAGDTAWG